MIRQAISCDVCGAEKKQTNHWFVATEQSGELRLTGWNSRMRLRPGTKHLCGQTCLHKLVDEYIARTIEGRLSTAATEPHPAQSESDISLTSPTAFTPVRPEKLATAQPLASARPAAVAQTTAPPVVQFPQRIAPQPTPLPLAPQADTLQLGATPQYASRRWRAEAWERERNRELHNTEGRARHNRL